MTNRTFYIDSRTLKFNGAALVLLALAVATALAEPGMLPAGWEKWAALVVTVTNLWLRITSAGGNITFTRPQETEVEHYTQGKDGE